jgi:voltage-gated potassium channel
VGPVLVFVFSFVYLSLSHANPNHFSEPLDHVRAVYFTVSVISTVGFGDIVPRTDAARLFVIVQMALDLILIVGIARSLVFAAKIGARRRKDEREP